MNRDHSVVFEIASKYCILDSFVDHDGYSISYSILKRRDVIFIIRDWSAKVGRQETPGITGKFGLGVQNEAGQRLIEFCQENALVKANTLFQQHKRRLYTWTSPDGQY